MAGITGNTAKEGKGYAVKMRPRFGRESQQSFSGIAAGDPEQPCEGGRERKIHFSGNAVVQNPFLRPKRARLKRVWVACDNAWWWQIDLSQQQNGATFSN